MLVVYPTEDLQSKYHILRSLGIILFSGTFTYFKVKTIIQGFASWVGTEKRVSQGKMSAWGEKSEPFLIDCFPLGPPGRILRLKSASV